MEKEKKEKKKKEGENVHLLTRTTARGVGKNVIEKVGVIYLNNYEKKFQTIGTP